MGMNIQTATEKIKIFLENNLVDPLNDRTSAWIYDDGMRIDLDKTPFPKILLKKTEQPSLKEQLAIGNTSTENTDRIIIQIKTAAGNNYTDNITETDYTAIEFGALIAQRAEDAIKENHTYFVNQGFLDILAKKDEMIIDKDRNPTFNLEIEMHYISTPE